MTNEAVNARLGRLSARRTGLDRFNVLTVDAQSYVINKSLTPEAWQKLSRTKPNTAFAIGSMQPVDANYTRISLETADRINNQITKRVNLELEFKVQGSVALNVHIRGVSDVDLLVLTNEFLTYATAGARSNSGYYSNPTALTSVDVLRDLRLRCESALREAFPAATVDSSGSKALKIHGGSLARPVDVVPAHWYDTFNFQNSGIEYDRAVRILDINKNNTINNWPFLHIHLISERCKTTHGGLRKAIRLLKNVKAELEAENRKIYISSFDIAALMYHADMTRFAIGYIYELSILGEVQRYLDYLYQNKNIAAQLMVPDGSRLIFDSPEKTASLLTLSYAVDQLMIEVAKEQNYLISTKEKPSHLECREAINYLSVDWK
jgi:hypothetical protein